MLIVLVAAGVSRQGHPGLLPNVGAPEFHCSACSATHGAGVRLMGLPWRRRSAGSLIGRQDPCSRLIAYVDLSKLGPDASIALALIML